MTYTLDTPLNGPSLGSPDLWRDLLESYPVERREDVYAFIDTVYATAPSLGVRAEMVVWRSWHETADPDTGVPWASRPWREKCNPAGIGITGDEGDYRRSLDFQNGRNAALGMLVHQWLYSNGTILPALLLPFQHLDLRWQNAIRAGYAGAKQTIGPLSGTWAADRQYGQKIIDKMNGNRVYEWAAYDPTTSPPQEAPMPGIQKVRLVGIKEDIFLPDDILVEVDIVPTTRTNVRSRRRNTSQTLGTWHDTGNDGSDADDERGWLHKSMPASQSAGYNGAADGVVRTVKGKKYRGKFINLTPFDEDTWAAGTTAGNRKSWHIEQCFDSRLGEAGWQNSLYVTSSVWGAIFAAKGWTVEQMVQHFVWYGKNCPGQIRRRGSWSQVLNMVAGAMAWSTAAAKGVSPSQPTEPVDGWPYPDPVPPSFWTDLMDGRMYVSDRGVNWFRSPVKVRTSRVVKRNAFAVNDDRVNGPDLPADVVIRLEAVGTSVDDRSGGNAWGITTEFTRIDLDGVRYEAEQDQPAKAGS